MARFLLLRFGFGVVLTMFTATLAFGHSGAHNAIPQAGWTLVWVDSARL